MEKPPLLYLVHRIPYPPNKGDKVRSFNILKWLSCRYRVYLGTFIDQPEDWVHLDKLREWCADICVLPIRPRLQKLFSLRALLFGEALTLAYYRDGHMARWVRTTVREQGIEQCVVFCSAMTQYVDDLPLARVVDFCDVDSEKWRQYADKHAWPMSALYRREGERLLAAERDSSRRAAVSIFATQAEADLFQRLAPEAQNVVAMDNGVDADFFSPEHELANPYPEGVRPLVFTGAMDYWPNIDAVEWFVREALPSIRARNANMRFYIVGMNPAPAVQALASEPDVVVTGSVPDIRPWLRFAAAAVVPLRVARGIQNKVLEAMAMGCSLVVSEEAANALRVERGREIEVVDSAERYAQVVQSILDGEHAPMGAFARERVLADYSWQAHLAILGDALSRAGPSQRPASESPQ